MIIMSRKTITNKDIIKKIDKLEEKIEYENKISFRIFLLTISITYIFLGASIWINMSDDFYKNIFIIVAVIIGFLLMIYSIIDAKKIKK